MSIQKKSINQAKKNVEKPAAAKIGAKQLSGKSLASMKQLNMTKLVDVSSAKLHTSCATGEH
jgi:type VI protein secretion system component Hcp